MATTLSPTSSHSMNSSRHSSNRSAATRGSQYLFGRLARTESASSRMSCGTNGYVISLWNHTSMGFSLRPNLFAEEPDHAIGEHFRLLDLRMVSGLRNQLEARSGNQPGVVRSVRRADDAVRGAP